MECFRCKRDFPPDLICNTMIGGKPGRFGAGPVQVFGLRCPLCARDYHNKLNGFNLQRPFLSTTLYKMYQNAVAHLQRTCQ